MKSYSESHTHFSHVVLGPLRRLGHLTLLGWNALSGRLTGWSAAVDITGVILIYYAGFASILRNAYCSLE